MSEDNPDPRSFYLQRVPEQFNRALREQERAVEESQRALEGMRAVSASIRVEVSGAGGGTFHLNIDKGQMTAADAATHAPFMTLVQDRAAFERLATEAGDSAMGLLGGLSGLAGEMKLTKARLDTLSEADGSLCFEVTGEDGFSILTHFGAKPVPDEPDTTIRVNRETYAALRSGSLDPQAAFMGGQIEVQGDMQLAMQLALAALAPD